MPKSLSLKKAKSSVPAKSQSAITQFFKNIIVPSSQNIQKSVEKETQSSLEICISQRPLKRRATSPDRLETIEISEEPDDANCNSAVNNNSSYRLKKMKNNHVPEITSSDKVKLCIESQSLCKENYIKLSQSPVKLVIGEQKSTQRKDNIVEEIKERSPLTPIELVENVESNHICCNRTSDSPVRINHHVCTEKWKDTPKKTLQFDNHVEDISLSPRKLNKRLHRSPNQELKQSPSKSLVHTITPVKADKYDVSPSKSGSTVKTFQSSQNPADDIFADEWDMNYVDDDHKEDLDLCKIQRCEVLWVTRHVTRLDVRLKNAVNERATCFIEGIWLDTPLSPGEVVSVIATRDPSGQFVIGNSSGLLSLRPDHLMSSTSVVAGVFCKRKALLQERWRGIDSTNIAMTIGILTHELVQKALTENITQVAQLRSEVDSLLKGSVQMLYDAGLSEEEARTNMQIYIPPLAEFMDTYMNNKSIASTKKQNKDQWNGQIEKVLDIEENMCCPQLGLKGKIDATLQVTIHERKGRQRAVVPLELKTGKASVSAEHRGQLVLYGMMLSLLRNEDPTISAQTGLLLYLKDRVDLREVSCGYPERRDLIMLRNQLVQYIAPGPEEVDPEQVGDIEEAASLLQQRLPEPVNHHSACTKCPYLTLCSLHLWHTDGPSVSESHPLSKLKEQAVGHLTREHIKYFLNWTALLKMEERQHIMSSPLHSLWTDSAEKRVKRGTCAANLKLKSVEVLGDKYQHLFERQTRAIETLQNESSKIRGPQEGDFSTVSLDNRPWIAAGVVTLAKDKEIKILLERDLSRRLHKDTLFHIDTYESYATTVQNLTNLGVLLEDSDRALRLRTLIIDKDAPEFEKKLPREVGRLGAKMMRSLNIEQQRAVLKALAAKDYALLQGLPGTGKTQTISVLIQMLVGLKQRVLVTAHTHSAVDNVLSRLPESLKIMRLGSSARVAANLHSRCEQQLVAACDTPLQLELLYNSMEVVGVTCLGSAHALLSRSTFDVCIVDEATQVLQSTVLRPLFAAKRFVLVGDPDQLPPVVRSRAARRLGMEESLFHRLMNKEVTSTLQLQYRMNRPLADIANRVAYDSRLKCADQKVADARLNIDMKKLPQSTAEWLQTACSPEAHHAALFLDMECINTSSDKGLTNLDEACVVLALVDALIQGGIKPMDIGVIAPYRDQVALLRRVVSRREVECSTVDQFQGRDKSVILYSCTRREKDDRKVKDGEILNDQRRLAVSVTRAKHKLLIVGNSRTLCRYTPLQLLLDACTTLRIDKNIVLNVVNKYKEVFL